MGVTAPSIPSQTWQGTREWMNRKKKHDEIMVYQQVEEIEDQIRRVIFY